MHNGTVSSNNNQNSLRVPLAVAEEDFQGNLEPTVVGHLNISLNSVTSSSSPILKLLGLFRQQLLRRVDLCPIKRLDLR